LGFFDLLNPNRLQIPSATLDPLPTDSPIFYISQAGFIYQLLAGIIFLHLDEIATGSLFFLQFSSSIVLLLS